MKNTNEHPDNYKNLVGKEIVLYYTKDAAIILTKLLTTTKHLLKVQGTGDYIVPVKKRDVVVFPITAWDMLRFMRRRIGEKDAAMAEADTVHRKKLEKAKRQIAKELRENIDTIKQRFFADNFLEENVVNRYAYRIHNAANKTQPMPESEIITPEVSTAE